MYSPEALISITIWVSSVALVLWTVGPLIARWADRKN